MSILECLACGSTFHETDQTRSEQRDGLCPSCGYEDLKEVKPLEVDAFAIDLRTLARANDIPCTTPYAALAVRLARANVVEAVVKNLALDDKKRFEEYQEQNNLCKEVE